MKTGVILTAGLILSSLFCHAAQTYRFDPTNSFIQIHLGTSGIFGGLGHEHLIRTPVQHGTFSFDSGAPSHSSVELVVDARQLKVIDPELSPQDREKVQSTMESARVLGVQQFPTITFKSTAIESAGQNHLVVRGNLTVRGITRPVTVQVTLTQRTPELRAIGQSQFTQSQFGIKPVSAGMGTVRVRDLMTIESIIQGFAAR